MKRILTAICIAALSMGLSTTTFAEKAAKKESKPINSACPISGKAVDGGATLDVPVGFCCGNCKGKFTKNPGKYLAKAAAAEKGACPMSGRAVKESATANVTVGFCCNNCKGKFKKDAQANLSKVKPAS